MMLHVESTFLNGYPRFESPSENLRVPSVSGGSTAIGTVLFLLFKVNNLANNLLWLNESFWISSRLPTLPYKMHPRNDTRTQQANH